MISAWSTLSTVLSLFFFFSFFFFFFSVLPSVFHFTETVISSSTDWGWLSPGFLSHPLFFFFPFLLPFPFFFLLCFRSPFRLSFAFAVPLFVIFVLQCDAPPFLLQTSNAHICASSLAAGVYSLSLSFFFFLLSCSLTRGKRKVVRGDKSSTRWYDSPAGFVIQWGRKTYLFLYTNSCQALLSLFFFFSLLWRNRFLLVSFVRTHARTHAHTYTQT